ncbi:MAG: signal peptidase [Pseudomonadota bacterium]|jgi:signal peptidase I
MIRDAFLHAFEWSGRARRRAIWAYAGFALLVLSGSVFAEVWFSGGAPAAPRLVFLLAAVLLVPMISLAVRRLHDRGHWGGWLLLGFLPWVGVLLWAYLLLAPTDPRAEEPDTPAFLPLVGAGLSVILVLLVASRAFWAPYWIVSGSMKPGLLVGDYMIVRFAQATDVTRGDVLLFRASHGDGTAAMVARLIGLPGDQVQMRAGKLVLNGAVVSLAPRPPFAERNVPQGAMQSLPRCGNAPVGAGGQCITERLQETLPDGSSHDVLDLMTAGPADDTGVFDVPDGQFFMLGDNRDDSLDSRFDVAIGGMGLVAADDVIGRATRVLVSTEGRSLTAFWTWRADRFLQVVP